MELKDYSFGVSVLDSASGLAADTPIVTSWQDAAGTGVTALSAATASAATAIDVVSVAAGVVNAEVRLPLLLQQECVPVADEHFASGACASTAFTTGAACSTDVFESVVVVAADCAKLIPPANNMNAERLNNFFIALYCM